MNKRVVIGILVVFVLAAAIVIATKSNGTGSTVSNSNTPGTAVQSSAATASSADMKFSDSPYYQYSYLISGDTLSSDAQNAIAGFRLNHTSNSDGTTTYTLTALQAGYVSQTYTLKPGQSLYFIERSMGDDDTTGNADYNLGDDHAVVVDSNGNIVQ